jgi:hypothetical protein
LGNGRRFHLRNLGPARGDGELGNREETAGEVEANLGTWGFGSLTPEMVDEFFATDPFFATGEPEERPARGYDNRIRPVEWN